MRHAVVISSLALAGLLVATSASSALAQTPANDPSARLRQVLPADVAERVLATIASARARDLPAEALENRALKFAAKGVAPRDIEKSVAEQEERMGNAKSALQRGRSGKPAAEEIEAGAEALRKGVSGADVSALAKSAPSGRSLAVPLFVVGSLLDRGLPSDQALERVRGRLLARVSDADIQALTASASAGPDKQRPTTTTPTAGPKRPPGTGVGTPTTPRKTPSTTVPANPGGKTRPATPAPTTPPTTPRKP